MHRVLFDGDKGVMGTPCGDTPCSGLPSAPKLLSELSFILLGALLLVPRSKVLASTCVMLSHCVLLPQGPSPKMLGEELQRSSESGKQKDHYSLDGCQCCYHSRSSHKKFIPQSRYHTSREKTGQHAMDFS